MTNMIFVVLIGHTESKNPDSLDQKFKKAMPMLYKYLDIIGFRSS